MHLQLIIFVLAASVLAAPEPIDGELSVLEALKDTDNITAAVPLGDIVSNRTSSIPLGRTSKRYGTQYRFPILGVV
ncbi:hypothetical protein K458DRAFT_383192 [Lentithecium fluviatile CBS 122367]|uniref:Uncharacterized protein n=1 Tax=Lentithecium fluviatile CBS 122367 TaxID=1168545 RepID=A0A6G1JHL5_9PLEO|nr:hypothetical protein K458DRAFT_383192 [Lentithecium fluviatile CBS 122367]